METIKIKYCRPGMALIEPISNGDWIDLRAGERVCVRAGDYVQIPLGIAVQLPEGYEAIIAPRSSTYKQFGIVPVNGIGIIDESYCGDGDEWHFLAYALRSHVIPKNARIAQFRIVRHQPPVELKIVETLGNPDRGGIGSTGKE